jgi:hypothetical protein
MKRMIAFAAAFAIAFAVCGTIAYKLGENWSVKMVFASGGLNVRENPSIDSRAVYLLEDRETVIVLSELDGWFLVSKNNNPDGYPLGWVCGDYVK